MPLSPRDAWIFDLDGTLTVAAHDFDAIRAELGLPAGEPILEAIAQRPRAQADALNRRLDEIEHELAMRSRPQPAAEEVLARLAARGRRLGILTRNSEAIARTTLEAVGLSEFFSAPDIVGRESCAPKPQPDGINELLRSWEITPLRAVMIGDNRFDLEAGRSAGTATVYFDPAGERGLDALADHRVEHLAGLLELLASKGDLRD